MRPFTSCSSTSSEPNGLNRPGIASSETVMAPLSAKAPLRSVHSPAPPSTSKGTLPILPDIPVKRPRTAPSTKLPFNAPISISDNRADVPRRAATRLIAKPFVTNRTCAWPALSWTGVLPITPVRRGAAIDAPPCTVPLAVRTSAPPFTGQRRNEAGLSFRPEIINIRNATVVQPLLTIILPFAAIVALTGRRKPSTRPPLMGPSNNAVVSNRMAPEGLAANRMLSNATRDPSRKKGSICAMPSVMPSSRRCRVDRTVGKPPPVRSNCVSAAKPAAPKRMPVPPSARRTAPFAPLALNREMVALPPANAASADTAMPAAAPRTDAETCLRNAATGVPTDCRAAFSKRLAIPASGRSRPISILPRPLIDPAVEKRPLTPKEEKPVLFTRPVAAARLTDPLVLAASPSKTTRPPG